MNQLIDMVTKNEIPDAKTVVGLFKAKQYLEQ